MKGISNFFVTDAEGFSTKNLLRKAEAHKLSPVSTHFSDPYS